MKKYTFLFLCAIIFGCNNVQLDVASEKNKINITLDAWHKAAAEAKFDNYFSYFTDDAVFIGTDATENWNKKAFAAWSKPYFDKGKAWNFTSLERHIDFDASGKTAWFDELLNTQMKICRGSGVLVKINNDWKISQYVLSMTMPNDKIADITKLKAQQEDSLISVLQKNR